MNKNNQVYLERRINFIQIVFRLLFYLKYKNETL